MKLVGTIIDNRYQIIEPIGKGGMSVVFNATDLTTNQSVVLKLMKEEVTSTHIEDIIRFKREIEIVTKFDHPGIIKLYGSGEFNGKPYLAMELLIGNNLKDLLNSGHKFSVSEITAIIGQISEALIYVHHHGIIHRDLKPGNIFITSDAGQIKVKLLDFGTALVMELGAVKDGTMVIGTFGYMSPEATGILENRTDERSDLYSLGVIFYQLLTGTLPFTGNNVNQIIHRQVALRPPAPRQINPDIPAILEAMVLKMLQKDPDLRYQSAKGLLADLERFENGEWQFEIGSQDPKVKLTYQTRLIGRETEIAKIKELISQTKLGHGSICLIAGEAGIGKTRLVEEIRSFVYEMEELFIGGRCLNHKNKTPYQPFKDAVDDYLGKLETKADEMKFAEVNRLKTLLADLGQIIMKISPRFEKYMDTPKKPATPETEQQSQGFLNVFADLFCNLASQGKICVLFIDDLQWADEGSFNLLLELSRKIDSSNLLILGTYRDNEIDRDHGLERFKKEFNAIDAILTEIKLDRFNHEHMNQLVTYLLGEKEKQTQKLTQYIFKKTSGNPFFAINIIRELVENKAVSWKESDWEENWDILNQMPVSDTMLSTILRRIERLTPGQNQLLCKAAVIGREFVIELLYSLTDLDQVTIVTWIDKFIANQLLERSSVKGKVLFVHDRIRDAFYHQLTETNQKEIHLQIAKAIEMTSPNPDEVIYELAHHYFEGGDQEKTLQFMLPAADKAKDSWANEEAIKYYIKVIDILESKQLRNPEWFHAQENLIQLYVTTGQLEDGIRVAEKVLPFVTDKLVKARIYKKLGACFHGSSTEQCINSSQKGLELLGEKIPRNNFEVIIHFVVELTKHGLYQLFPVLFFHKQSAPVYDEDREIVKLYCIQLMVSQFLFPWKFYWLILRILNISEKRIGKSFELALSYVSYSELCMIHHLRERAFQFNQKALNVDQEIHNEWGIATGLHSFGSNHFYAGNNHESIKHFEQAITIFEKLGDITELTFTLNGLGNTYYYISDYPNSIKTLEKSLSLCRKKKDFGGICNSLFLLSMCNIEKGDFQYAQELFAEAQKVNSELENPVFHYNSLVITGYLELERNNFNLAIESFEAVKKVSHMFGFKPEITSLFYYLADAQIKKMKGQSVNANNNIPKSELKRIVHLCREAMKKTKPWPNHHGGALRAMANYYHLAGKNHQAEKYFLKSITHDQKINRLHELGKDYLEYGNFLESRHQTSQAKETWRKAYDIFKNIGAAGYTQRIAVLLQENSVEPEDFDDSTAKDRLKFERRMNTVLTTSSYINSTLDIDELLERILDSTMELLGAETGLLLLYPESGAKHLEVKVCRRITMEEYQGQGFAPSRSIIAKVEQDKSSLIITDATADAELKAQSSVVIRGIRSVICAPVINKDQMLGVIYLDHCLLGGLFSNDDLKILDAIANQAGVSIENALLYTTLKNFLQEIQANNEKMAQWNQELEACVSERTSQLHEKNIRLEAMNTELAIANRQLEENAAQIEELTLEKERNRFAKDLHDSLGRTMTISLALLEACDATYDKEPSASKEKLAEAIKMTRTGIKELRNSIFGLTSAKLTSQNLSKTLHDLITEYQVTGLNVDLYIEGNSNCQDLRYFDVIYRVCQEALTNSLRHGKAKNVSIIIQLTNQWIKTSILDDGSGCKNILNGMGLTAMEQRVRNVNGNIFYSSDGEQGFNIIFELPLEELAGENTKHPSSQINTQ